MEDEYSIRDIRLQLEAVESLEKEFLTLVWNKGYEGAKERHERITEALEKAGGALDIRALWKLFYRLEQVAIKEINVFAHLAQEGTEALKQYPDIPDELKANIVALDEWVKKHKKNREISKGPRLKRRKEKERVEFQDYWDRWKKGEIHYDGVTKFDDAMIDKLGISRVTALDWRQKLEQGGRIDAPT